MTQFCSCIAACADCGNPADKIDDTITVICQSEFSATEGTNVTFNYPPGSVLVGSNAAVCTENEEWEPDPREVKCAGDI